MQNNDAIEILNSVFKDAYIHNGQYRVFCPFHDHHKQKMEINIDDESEHFLYFHCWICNKSGRNASFLLKDMKADKKYIEQLNKLSLRLNKFNISEEGLSSMDLFRREITNKLNNTSNIVSNKKNNEELLLPKEYKRIDDYYDNNNIFYLEAVRYLMEDRNLSMQDIIRYKLGFCDRGKYKGRIIIPSYDNNLNLNYYVARDYMTGSAYSYINADAEKDIIFNEYLINWNYPVILCEGPFDAISIKSNSIPILGKILRPKLKEKLINNNATVVIFLDNDAINDAIGLCKTLYKHIRNVYYVNIVEDKDPGGLNNLEIFNYIGKNTIKYTDKIGIIEKLKRQK